MGTPNTGRRLDWSASPLKIMPQLCINSLAVRSAVSNRATLIGNEIVKGIEKLKEAHKEYLFIGVIAGWETRIGRDFDTGKNLGYCALTNAGYSAKNPPADIDIARSNIVTEFISHWSQSLIGSGVPTNKIFSHVAFMSSTAYRISQDANLASPPASYLEVIDFSPPPTAFCDHCIPGLSTYPQPGLMEQWQQELSKHSNPPWASYEGTDMEPAMADLSSKGTDMESYLGKLFNHGAVMVNIFGWGVATQLMSSGKEPKTPTHSLLIKYFCAATP
jgi:hypothetical protein